MLLERLLTNAKVETLRRLGNIGIDDDEWQTKIKRFPPEARHALAMYRAGSQFRSRPIFWINEDFFQTLAREKLKDPKKQIVLTLLHEYGHVIYEFAKLRVANLYDTIQEEFFADEEDFAETFAVMSWDGGVSPEMRSIVMRYMTALRGE